ncbi:MAG: DUF3877 family protein [Candidatus Methanogranum gryphiswaldense]|nr:MAG: DUF3877 family protein [Candidatus Methanogranum sp. U3.2.1]
MDSKELENAVISTIQETQVKLGLAKGAVSLYIPLDSLFSPDGICNGSNEILDEFMEDSKERLGKVECSILDNRVRIIVPEEGCRYVSTLPVSPVLKVFVDSVLEHVETKELKARLQNISADCIWKDIEGEEFDSVVYFKDGTDPYVYCITTECGHLTYHRFSREDYSKLGFVRI